MLKRSLRYLGCNFHFLPLKLPHFFWGFLPTFLQYPQQSELDPQGDPGPLKVSKSQKQFFLKLNCSKSALNFWHISALASKICQIKKHKFTVLHYLGGCFLIWPILEARAEIWQKFRSLFGQWDFKKNCFWDLLTFTRFNSIGNH